DIEHAPALEAGREALVDEPYRHIDADACARADALKVHVHELVIDGIDLNLAGNDAGFAAIQIEIEDGGEEAPALHQIDELIGVEGDVLGRFAVAIDDGGHQSLATYLACAARASARPRMNLDRIDLGHWLSLLMERQAPLGRIR